MKEATLIQCTNSKRDESAIAHDLYDESTYFCKMRAWAQSRPGPWFILSAKHGLLEPTDWIQPYDERGLSVQQASEIARELTRRDVTQVRVCAGRDYLDPLVPELECRGIDVIDPFAGLKIGERMSELESQTYA